MINVENIKFEKKKSPSLFHKQKLDGARKQCRHLKPLRRITLLDEPNDETIDVEVCDMCNHQMTDKDIKLRKLILKKYE